MLYCAVGTIPFNTCYSLREMSGEYKAYEITHYIVLTICSFNSEIEGQLLLGVIFIKFQNHKYRNWF